MEKNKSIDGLAPRRPKKAASSISNAKTATKKTSKAKPPKPTKSTRVSQPPKAATLKAPTHQEPIPQPSTPSTKPIDVTEDFLKPVQVFDFDEATGEFKTATDPNDNPKKTNRKMKEKKPISKKRKIITSIILVIVLLLIGGITWLVLWGNDIIAKITGGQGNVLDLLTFTEETYEPLKTDENGRTNILAFGTSGYNMEGEEKGGTHDGAQLTDSIMIISLDQKTGDIAMVSIPRDLKASPTCTATGKINEVYWCNGGKGNISSEEEAVAAQALMNEVGKVTGIDFQYYAHLNWGSLINIVDTLGGITVTVDENIHDYYVFEEGGTYDLNGEAALWLARIRHGTAHGDFTRSASQQKILIGIKNKILEKNFSVTELINLASTLGDNLRTNFSLEEIKTLAHLTKEYDLDSMRQISLIEPERLVTTGTINGISYVLPVGGAGYYTNIQNYLNKMLSSDPRNYEDASILVLNGTDTPGVAGTEQTTLEKDGYSNIYIDDAPAGEYTDQYTLYALNTDKPGTKKLLEEKYGTAHSAEELPTGINTNCDFVLILGANPTE